MGRTTSSGIALTILKAIADGADFIVEAHRRPTALLVCGLDALRIQDILAERHRLQTAACRLRRQGMLAQRAEGDRKAYALTEKGRIVLQKCAPVDPPLLPIGEITIVSYDIPERHASARQAFRRLLCHRGFRRFHRSVWVSDRDWITPLSKTVTDLKLGDWVWVSRSASASVDLCGKTV